MTHQDYMYRCLDLAAKGRGKVGINPMVGSVLVREEKIIAEDFYDHFGAPHAEASLLKSMKGKIEKNDILYISLEPCCHHGKTPPCTDAILESGVKHVVFGMKDPDSRVSGKGIEILKDAGIEVIGPVLPVECRRLNRGYISLRTVGRPWITLKSAQTQSGEIANKDGSPMKITSAEQDEWSHEFLRARHDAVLVGVETVIRDDPQLTVRMNKKVEQNKNLDHVFEPYRVIFDPNGRLPKDAKVKGDKLIVVSSVPGSEWFVPIEDGHFVWNELWKILTTSKEGFPGISSILVEGGKRTWAHFKESQLYDEEVILIGN